MLQSLVVFVLVGRKAVLTQNQLRQIQGETIRIFQRKHIHTADLRLTCFLCLIHQLIQQTNTLVQRTQERLFLTLDNRRDLCLLCLQFRIGLTQIFNQLRHELIKERTTHIEERVTVTHRTSQDTTDDISGFLVTRQLTVRDRKRNRTDVVGNDTHRDIDLLVLTVFASADSADTTQHRLEDIGVVVRGLTLDRTYQTLKAHTGVDHFLCQRFETAVRFAVKLHEDDVPDLNHLWVIFVNQLTTGHLSALFSTTTVHMDLRTRTARTRITHLPEVIVLVTVQNMVCRQMFRPDRSSLVVTCQTFFG